MSAPRKGKHRGGKPRKKAEVYEFPPLRWGSAEATRKTLAALATGFAVGSVTESQLRVLVYAGRALLPFFEFERVAPFDSRMDAVEEKLGLGKWAPHA